MKIIKRGECVTIIGGSGRVDYHGFTVVEAMSDYFTTIINPN